MIKYEERLPSAGERKVKGYAGKIINLTIEKQYLDPALWRETVEQYRVKSDNNGDWRGEYWGKLMRGACLTYEATGNKKLYSTITESVKDMLSAQGKDGRFSTYDVENELVWWDMWCRKYVMLGFLYYYEIAKSEPLKKRIVRALKKHADSIMKRVGKCRGKKDITDTSVRFGAMNSCSILEPFVKLYEITGEKKYLDYSEYIIGTGMSKDFDLVTSCAEKTAYPYEFKYTKAYEMTSCVEGLLEYYETTGNARYLTAAKNFAEMIVGSDYTVIGCAGCTNELLDNSSVKQTEYSEEIMQETCVTVTLMGLFGKLLQITGEAKYAEYIERSGYNALFGAVNTENQSMKSAKGFRWEGDECIPVEHEAYLFDSYSPLYMNKRARAVGGFQVMSGGRAYGCCVSIGGAGTATFGLLGITKGKNKVYINLYNDGELKENFGERKLAIAMRADTYVRQRADISVKGDGASFAINLRVPSWADKFTVELNGEKIDCEICNGYAVIERIWNDDKLTVKFPAKVKAVRLNGKTAFVRGAIVLARDERFGEDMTLPVKVKTDKNGAVIGAKVVKNEAFSSNLAVKIKTESGEITLCDYSSAGKNYDDEHCLVTVWQN